MARDGLIHFVCTAREHTASRVPGLTEHNGEWALCPTLRENGHEWVDTGGLAVRDAFARWLSLIDAAAQPTPA